MALQDLAPGHKFPPESLVISEAEATAYAEAVGDASARPPGRVPSMAVIAAGLSRFIKHLGLADGTVEVVHASQEASFSRPVTPGEPLEIRATLKSNAERRGSRFAMVEMSFVDGSGEGVAAASSLIVVNAS
ncbi:MAG: MaoC family dehydratase N-terminal domain-containing protein [Dehalococcoidia bacterium]|jgi:3-hydroxymyristoyl/3-hydroxydecanoyl-(acyl carrier protein) dehydratase|nr:MaoC family dehydratase N-terminal domain-containing protein [Dehalococcoidia bacterium]